MKYKRNGKTYEEFFPQDLANDTKGQEQASRLIQGIRLRRVLEKTCATAPQIKGLLKVWMNRPFDTDVVIPTEDIFRVVPLDATEEEKVLFLELKKRLGIF